MVINKETKKYTQISGLDVDALGTKGASKFHWRSHLSLDKGPRFTLKIGFAPVNDISIMVGNTKPNYPLIQVGKDVKLEIVPMENKGAGFGLGFTPLLIYTGEGDPTIPDFKQVKDSIAEVINSAVRPKVHTKYTTWKPSASLGTWDNVDPLYYFPTDLAEQAELEELGESFLCFNMLFQKCLN